MCDHTHLFWRDNLNIFMFQSGFRSNSTLIYNIMTMGNKDLTEGAYFMTD